MPEMAGLHNTDSDNRIHPIEVRRVSEIAPSDLCIVTDPGIPCRRNLCQSFEEGSIMDVKYEECLKGAG